MLVYTIFPRSLGLIDALTKDIYDPSGKKKRETLTHVQTQTD